MVLLMLYKTDLHNCLKCHIKVLKNNKTKNVKIFRNTNCSHKMG